MKPAPALIARILAASLLVAAVVPEVSRYRGERLLYRASAALRIVLAGGAPDPSAALSWVESSSAAAGRTLPADPRPFVVAGSARLVARDAPGALAWYSRALATGERAEIDLNIGRAAMMGRDRMAAQRALLRAGWLSPLLLDELPEIARAPLRGEIERLEALLAEGRLPSAPPPPTLPSGAGAAAGTDANRR